MADQSEKCMGCIMHAWRLKFLCQHCQVIVQLIVNFNSINQSIKTHFYTICRERIRGAITISTVAIAITVTMK